MNLQRIEKLLEKYERGETTLSEEKELFTFFEGDTIPFHLRNYKHLFSFYNSAVLEELPDPEFDNKIEELFKKQDEKNFSIRNYTYPLIGIAAAVLLLLGLYFIFIPQQSSRDTFSDPELAMAETKKILLSVSNKLNSGANQMSDIKEISNGLDKLDNIKTFDQGLRKMQKISILDKSKDIITQKTIKR